MGERQHDVLNTLAEVIEQRRQADPESSYVADLLARGRQRITKKIGEEASELIIAALSESPDRVVAEAADLWFHTLVLLADQGISHERVLDELERRAGTSGLTEKARRTVEGDPASG